MIKIPIIVTMCIFAICHTYANTNYNKNSVFKELITKYGRIETLFAKFSTIDGSINNCTLLAKRGNKYNITIDGKSIISDGKTIWNYNKAKRNVVISEYMEEIAGITLDKFFFDIIGKLQPDHLEKYGNTYILKLKNTDKKQEIQGVSLTLGKDCKQIIAIEIITNETTQKWLVEAYKFNKPIHNEKFMFNISRDIEVIDMRDK